ncbi:MAG: flavodoxin domain-containing protein [Candidatus Omnitrophica bacterium]|nr:flavodoxin domain-containing protein [Candidatus Omnitrophota bacterium]
MSIAIIYSTRHGSVFKCAKIFKEKVADEIRLFDLNQKKHISLTDYNIVILGASVYFGRIQREMDRFCQLNNRVLLTKNVGLFLCAGEKSLKRNSYLSLFGFDLFTAAKIKRVLGHELYYEKLSFLEKIMIKLRTGKDKSYSDLDYKEISLFVDEINSLK